MEHRCDRIEKSLSKAVQVHSKDLVKGDKLNKISGKVNRETQTKADFYVAPYGDDNDPGTEQKPFTTLARARDAVCELKKKKTKGNITVLIRGGTYRLTESTVFGLEDSGSEEQVITYAAYPGEEPIFTSGFKITGWKKLESEPEGLPAVARGKVWVADIPETKGGKWRFHCLFDVREPLDRKQLLSRARSKGFKPQPVKDFKGGGLYEKNGMTFATTEQKSILHFPGGALKNWPNLDDVEIIIYPRAPYTTNILSLEWVDEDSCMARTTIPATYPMNPAERWYVDPIREKDAPLRKESAWVENVLEALDEPGEWVLNTHEGKLYLWPKKDEPGDEIFAPCLKELIRAEGRINVEDPEDVPVRYLVFRGLTFAHGDRDVWTKDDAGIQHDWEMYDKSTALVRFRGAEHCTVDSCQFINSGGTGVRFDLYSQYNCVKNSLFAYLGQSAVLVCGYGPGTKDVSHHNEIVNNHIHHCGEIYTCSHGIIIWQSGENRIAHNLIHDMPRKAILVAGVRASHFDPETKNTRECSRLTRWNDIGGARGFDYIVPFLHVRNNVVEYNEAYRILGKGEDGGGINITGCAEGNIVRRNYLHHIDNPMADAAIRLDGNGRGTLIAENIIYRCTIPGINFRDMNNYIENNIIVDVSSGRHKHQQGYLMFGREGTGRVQRNLLYQTGEKIGFLLNLEGSSLSQFKADYNLYYTASNPEVSSAFLHKLQKEGTDKHSISANPLFVDLDNQDFRLKPNSPLFKLGFKQINLKKIGLTQDLPRRFGNKEKR